MQSTEFIHGVTRVEVERSELSGGYAMDIIVTTKDGSEKAITLFSQDGEPLDIERGSNDQP